MLPTALSLDGLTIGITADRRADEQANLLVQRGANVLHGPVLRSAPIDDDGEVRSATTSLLARPADVVIANTAVGIRGWLSLADSWGLADALVSMLSGAYVAVRGPKAAGALLAAGVDTDWRSPSSTLAQVVDHVIGRGVQGRRVALQLDGGEPDGAADRLRAVGAEVVAFRTYHWTLPDDVAPARRLLDAVCRGRVDAVTFTAAPAVQNLFALAGGSGAVDALTRALNGPVLAMCIGPVCRAAALERGVFEARAPQVARLGSMVKALADELDGRRRPVVVDGVVAEVLGSHVTAGGTSVSPTVRERAVFDVLARRPGAVVAKGTVLQEVWGASATDNHALEATVARLRRRLEPTGLGVEAVVRRGYRLASSPRRTDTP